MLDKVIITPLATIYNDKGNIYRAMKKSDIGFNGFGEAFFSAIKTNEIKGWKKHSVMTLNIIVPVGIIKFVVTDGDKFIEVVLSMENYLRINIPPGYWLAFKGIASENILLNISNVEHDPLESSTLPLEHFKYEW